MNNNETEKLTNNAFDYSNIIPLGQYIAILVQYCETECNKYLQLIKEDEERNEKIKYEYQNYQYGKIYQTSLTITICDKNFKYIECKNAKAFNEAIQNKQVNNVKSLTIELNICFKRGQNENIKDHNNEFILQFEPYEITFTRKSNFNDIAMNQIENNINELLKKFPKVDTIFCTKE